jgi:hypothetical protein
MDKLVLELDYLCGPIVKNFFDPIKAELCTGINVIDSNSKIQLLNDDIQKKYASIYEFDKDDNAVSFNLGTAKEIKVDLLSEIKELIQCIENVNDGSFFVEDNITKEIENW